MNGKVSQSFKAGNRAVICAAEQGGASITGILFHDWFGMGSEGMDCWFVPNDYVQAKVWSNGAPRSAGGYNSRLRGHVISKAVINCPGGGITRKSRQGGR